MLKMMMITLSTQYISYFSRKFGRMRD